MSSEVVQVSPYYSWCRPVVGAKLEIPKNGGFLLLPSWHCSETPQGHWGHLGTVLSMPWGCWGIPGSGSSGENPDFPSAWAFLLAAQSHKTLGIKGNPIALRILDKINILSQVFMEFQDAELEGTHKDPQSPTPEIPFCWRVCQHSSNLQSSCHVPRLCQNFLGAALGLGVEISGSSSSQLGDRDCRAAETKNFSVL